MSQVFKPLIWLYNEFGIASVYQTGSDAWLIIASRTLRMFAYGANSLIIALFFSSLEFTDFQIGLFMTLTLLGDVLLSLFLTLVADKVGRRRILLSGALLMVVSGIVFAVSENFWILLGAAVIGVISATGSDFGPFRAIEESVLSHLTTSKTRSDVLSWYVSSSILGSALGNEFSGRTVEILKLRDGWTEKSAYHAIFWLYILMGMITSIFAIFMSKKCELEDNDPNESNESAEGLLDKNQTPRDERTIDDENTTEDEDKIDSKPEEPKIQDPKKKASYISQISSETRSIMYRLWFLLTVDSLADGMVGYSLTSYYMDQKFHLAKSTLGDITFTSYILSAVATAFASPLTRYIGLIKTMVFTHLPSSLAVMLFPIPQNVPISVILFFIRIGLNNMDQAPRAAFIAAVVKPEERTAVMGITSMLRTLASTCGPSITGLLANNQRFWIAFVVAGALRVAYDLGLFAMFVNMKLDLETNEKDQGYTSLRRTSDEEEMTELEPIGNDRQGSRQKPKP